MCEFIFHTIFSFLTSVLVTWATSPVFLSSVRDNVGVGTEGQFVSWTDRANYRRDEHSPANAFSLPFDFLRNTLFSVALL